MTQDCYGTGRGIRELYTAQKIHWSLWCRLNPSYLLHCINIDVVMIHRTKQRIHNRATVMVCMVIDSQRVVRALNRSHRVLFEWIGESTRSVALVARVRSTRPALDPAELIKKLWHRRRDLIKSVSLAQAFHRIPSFLSCLACSSALTSK